MGVSIAGFHNLNYAITIVVEFFRYVFRRRRSQVATNDASCETCSTTHGEIFSKSYQIKPKSDCIYHAPIDLDHKRTRPFAF